MGSIFISYAREDRDRAELVARRLNEQGWSVWWDRQIAGGAQFDRVTEQAIAAAKVVIVLWSRYSIDSDWVRAEASWALDKKKLLPVTIDPVQPPLRFNLVQTLDLNSVSQNPTRSPGFETLIGEVARQLNTPAGRAQFQSVVDEVTARIAKGGPKIALPQARSAKPPPVPPPASMPVKRIDLSWTQTWRVPLVTLAVVTISLMFGFGYMMLMGDAPAVTGALAPVRPETLQVAAPQVGSHPAAPTSQITLPPAPGGMAPPLVPSHH